ncbi:diheme cytochrome c [Desulfosudis oleivorans]|uniref:Lipoprotein, putative n=1 Tax=Desulfosudis oleivorans (strain DSM 6200 / JCM 39069 / Hxd3) TaxID=96561 RepID=A8ZZM5_DESOH|nr:diheme cytochrome c [Desulfosudis oleivorans]ABW68897.1 lipoprotein, putative [Desulfosudis oleivorans Hxd3]
MSGTLKPVIGLVIILIWMGVPCDRAVADDDHEDGHREKTESHYRHAEGEHREHGLKPVDFPVYLEACGACHFAYQPELLPAASWGKILSGLDDHFGEAVALEEDVRQAVVAYLRSHSAETSSAKIAGKIMDSLEGQIPMRITDVFYIQKKHHGIPADVFKRASVGTFANCAACHTTAAGGVYDEDDVRIPR